MSTRRAALGISAHLGWAATVTIAVEKAGVRVLRSDRLEIAAPSDREAREPFHVVGGFDGLDRVPRPADPEAALRRGLGRQRRAAARRIAELAAALEDGGHRLAFAGLLVGRGRAAASFEQSIASHTQIHVEEGLAIRESIRRALEARGVRVVGVDQKALGSLARDALGRSEADLVSELRAKRPEDGGAWRAEERSAALAAWIAWARGGR